jgi:single-strand DNA-binding protein
MHGAWLADRVAIEPPPKEETEMARTKKTADTAPETEEVVVPLRPELEQGQPPVEEQPEAEDTTSEQASRGRGPGLNRVELIGRIAKGPDVRVTSSGMHVVYFRVATNGREDTEYHQCTAFGKTAEFIGEYLRTGRLVFLEGRLQTRAYDDQHGIRRWATTIVVNRLQVLDSRRAAETAEQ